MVTALPIVRSAKPAASEAEPLPAFHVMAKPIGPACNLGCSYCYYLHKEQLLGLPGLSGMQAMSDELLEKFVEQYIASQRTTHALFTWHGGEPTLLGLDFFRKVVVLQRKHCRAGMSISNDIQTNGTLLDDAWCEFLREHQILVGLSIDGPKEIHDAMRPSLGGKPTFDRVYAAARRLHKHGAAFTTLTVVNQENVHRAAEVYDFLTKDLGSQVLQLCPSAEHRHFDRVAPGFWNVEEMETAGGPRGDPKHPNSVVTDWSIAPDDWGKFLCDFFDRWHGADVGKVLVNWFSTWVGQWMGLPATLCLTADTCGQSMVVESDGNVYSCDHYVYPEYRLGNVGSDDLGSPARSTAQADFGKDKREGLPLYCLSCKYNFACHGECPRRRFLKTPDGQPGLNYFCAGYQRFFKHTGDRIAALGKRRQQGERV